MGEGAERGVGLGPRRLRHLLAARLFVAFGVLGAAFAMSAAELYPENERGLYAAIVTAFAVTIALAATLRTRFGRRYGGVQIPVDIAIVTTLILFSGGGESVFAFLYVPIAVYAALLFRSWAGYGAAVAASLAYGGVLLANDHGVGAPLPEALRVAMWGAQAGALLLVVMLSNALASERDRVGRALTERTRELGSLQELHARTVESLTSGLVTTDPRGLITSFNPEAERITGVDAPAAVGKPLLEVLPGVEHCFEDDARRTQVEFVDAGGALHHIGLSASSLRAEGDREGGSVVIFQDVTRIVEMEQALRHGERMAAVGELAARLAHEVRNPLAAISGSIEMLDQVGDDEGDRSRLRNIVLRETERLDQLIRDFLHYARPAPPAPRSVPLAPVVDEIEAMLEASLANATDAIEIHTEVEAGAAAHTDEGQLRQVLWNLCRNAVEAMPEGGRLEVRAGASQAAAPGDRNTPKDVPRVEIAVTDTGAGIRDDEIDRVFDPFFTTKTEGTGLGLATVHRIVESNGGEIAVDRPASGGTQFRVLLPTRAVEPDEGSAG